jgi:predicted anti-sigma-YlaC factor YlaD
MVPESCTYGPERANEDAKMPSCRDMTELSTGYLDRSLGWRTRIAMRWHLALCSRCRAYYDQLAKMLRLLRGLRLGAPDAALEARLLAAARGGGREGEAT